MRNVASFSASLKFEARAFRNAGRYLKSETNLVSVDDRPMSSASVVKLGPRIPEKHQEKVPPPQKKKIGR